jgi:putative transposase
VEIWTKGHRTRHEACLKEMVSTCAGEEMARWLEQADPPRSRCATPILSVVSAIAWHMRVGGSWRALPRGFLGRCEDDRVGAVLGRAMA